MRATNVRPKAPFAMAGAGAVIIAHRGGSLEAPENTVASVRHGVEVGADWQEIDVTLSRDERPVVIHDDTLERTTEGKGLVETKPWAELARLHTGKPTWDAEARQRLAAAGATVPTFGDAYPTEGIPLLGDVLAVARSRLMIEMKHTERPARLAAEVVRAVHDARASERVGLGSFDVALLEAAYQLDPGLPLIAIADKTEAFDALFNLPIAVLAVDKHIAEDALRLAPPGVAVWVWTVYTSDEAQTLARLGVHGLITDAPRAVVARLRPPAP